MMGIKTSKHRFILNENIIKPALGKSLDAFAENGVRQAERGAFKTAMEDWAQTNSFLVRGERATFDQMVEAGKSLGLKKSLENLTEGEALALLVKETGLTTFNDFTKRMASFEAKAAGESLQNAIATETNRLTRLTLTYLKDTATGIKAGLEDGSVSLATVKTQLEAVEKALNANTKLPQDFRDIVKKEINGIKNSIDNSITDSTSVAVEGSTLKNFDELVTSYEIDPKLKVKEPVNPKIPTKVKTETPIVTGIKGSKKKQIEQTIRDVLYYGDKKETRPPDINEVFDENPLIYDPTKANTPGFDEYGLDINFRAHLDNQFPKFIEDVVGGKKYKYRVNEDGTWSKLNKLDTNYSDKKILFEDYAKSKGFSNPDLMTSEEVDKLLSDFIEESKNNPAKIKDYLLSNEAKFTTKITEFSAEGERIVNNFESRFKTKPLSDEYTIVWKPKGEGNPLDLKGVDMVVKDKKGNFHFVQIKKSRQDLKVQPSKMVDKEGKNVIVGSTGSPVYLKNGLVCLEDSKGNWVIFKPQDSYSPTGVSIDPETGEDIKTYAIRLDDKGQPIKSFNKFTHFVDTNSPGKDFHTNLNLKPTE